MVAEKFLLVLPQSKSIFFAVLTGTIIVFSGFGVVALPPLEEKLSAISTIHTLFRHETSADDTYYGELWIEKPNKFRIESSAPWKQTLVSDGSKFWNYDADLEQLTIDWLEEDLRKFPILLFTGPIEDLAKFYDISGQSDQEFTSYQLVPKKPDQYYRAMRLTFRGLLPVSIAILDVMDNHTEFFFSSTQVNSDLKDELFDFFSPDDIDLLDRTTKTRKP